MPNSKIHEKSAEVSLGPALNELKHTSISLLESEKALVRLEFKAILVRKVEEILEIGVSGFFLFLSALAFLGFLIIGLGRVMQGKFWLSSLMISILFGLVGGVIAFQSFKKWRGL